MVPLEIANIVASTCGVFAATDQAAEHILVGIRKSPAS
jgi:hypothetical protein